MEDINDICKNIDAGLSEAQRVLDVAMNIEGDVWQQLNDSVEHGWCTMEEAQDRFMAWRIAYRGTGKNITGKRIA